MNKKHFLVIVEDMTRKLADANMPHPIIASSIVMADTKSEAMDDMIETQSEELTNYLMALHGMTIEQALAAEKRIIRISAIHKVGMTVIGHDGLTRDERKERKAQRKAQRKAAKNLKDATRAFTVGGVPVNVAVPSGTTNNGKSTATGRVSKVA